MNLFSRIGHAVDHALEWMFGNIHHAIRYSVHKSINYIDLPRIVSVAAAAFVAIFAPVWIRSIAAKEKDPMRAAAYQGAIAAAAAVTTSGASRWYQTTTYGPAGYAQTVQPYVPSPAAYAAGGQAPLVPLAAGATPQGTLPFPASRPLS
jgi:hypothetical protein